MSGAAQSTVREGLRRASRNLSAEGLPQPSMKGRLFRPLAAYLAAGELENPEPLWLGALAIEMVHEASLLHDDILDRADTRRGEPTLVARAGVSKAVISGDYLLTSAYTVAERVACPGFLTEFIRAVADTVRGELEQGQRAGQRLTLEEYTGIVAKKTGSLFGCATSLGARLTERDPKAAWHRLGVDLGVFYQKIDDLLDYVPEARTGKPPLQDIRQKKWTWPLHFAPPEQWELPEKALSVTTLQDCFEELEQGAKELHTRSRQLGLTSRGTLLLTDRWMAPCRRAIEARRPKMVAVNVTPRETVLGRAAALDGAVAQKHSFRFHSKSFSFAARLFPREARAQVAGVYAYCRFTDDLVDGAPPGQSRQTEALLDAWRELSQEAYEGRRTGCGLVDTVMGHMAEQAVPFRYARELIEGVRMDLRPRTYRNMSELRVYSYRVASVVGGWLTELFGVRHRWVLSRAAALGHAMQLTNILRDVGEDLAMGRIYLPQRNLEYHGLDAARLAEMAGGHAPISAGYRTLVQELMAIAEADYEAAFEAMPYLPSFFQRPVAVAARVYRGIHDSIRANGYDTLTRRAYTTRRGKIRLASAGLIDLSRARRAVQGPPPEERVTGTPWIPEDDEAVA